MGERISLADVRVDIEEAYFGLRDDEPIAKAARERVLAFLAQVEADQKQLAVCKAALEACVEVMDANGDYTRDSEAYTQALMALERPAASETVALRLPTPNPTSGGYRFKNGCVIQPAFSAPGKWIAFWPNGVALRGDNDKVSYFDSPEEVLAIFIDAGF